MRTLIVEDNPEKRGHISRALTQVSGFDIESVEYSTDVQSARRLLQQRTFDLLILDIALPLRGDSDVSPEGGNTLLSDVFSRPAAYRVPAHVIGITAYEHAYESAVSNFSSRLLTLIRYDPSSMDWELALQARVRHIIESLRVPHD